MRSFQPKDKDLVDMINRLSHPGKIKLDNKCIIRMYDTHGFYAFNTKDDIFNVLRFCVHPAWRGMGIGSLLHLDLLKLAKQHGKKRLQMIIHEESNSLTWFRDCWGWKGIKVVKDYFNNRDGYLLEREILV